MDELQEIKHFLEEFRVLQKSQEAEKIKQMEQFLIAYSASKPEFYQERIDKFNLFQILGISNQEIVHSRFLAWLLDYNSEHGQKDAFFRAFLKAAKIPLEPKTDFDYQVKTEHWEQEAFIDTVVYQPHEFLIYIENKIHASEGYLQLEREARDMQRFGKSYAIPKAKQYSVFLTPTGRKGETAANSYWHPLSYIDLSKALAEIASTMTPGKSRLMIEDWLENIKKWS